MYKTKAKKEKVRPICTKLRKEAKLNQTAYPGN